MLSISILFKAFRKISGNLILNMYTPLGKAIFYLNGAVIDSGLKVF